MIYLDNSATTRQYDEVSEVMLAVMKEEFANPSSLHRLGLAAEKLVKAARKNVAQALEARDEEIYFTSGGTESDNLALFGVAQARKRRGRKIVTSEIEHPAVMATCKKLESVGFQVEYVGANADGTVNLAALQEAVDQDTILISVMHVNNEVGSIQPLEQIDRIRKKAEAHFQTEILFHTDAVQSFGKMALSGKDADLISLSGHKIHGPKGIGALYVRKGLTIEPHLFGGGQERGLRSGTENVPAIAGLGKAVEIARKGLKKRLETMETLRNYLWQGICAEIKDVRVNSPREYGCPSILNVSFLGVRAEVLLHTLEQSEIYVSTGSACSSHKKGKSHVLQSMGLTDQEIAGAIRFSFSEFNSVEEADKVLQCLKNGVDRLRKLGSFR